LAPPENLDPEIIKSMIFRESRFGTGGPYMKLPPWYSEPGYGLADKTQSAMIMSPFNLGQTVDSWWLQNFIMIKEMDKALFDSYELGLLEAENLKKNLNLTSEQITRKDQYWSFMTEGEMTSWNNRAFSKAIKEFGEKKNNGKNMNETSEDNLFLDSDYYIRTMTRWLFVKYFLTVDKKTPKGNWKLAVALYNGLGADEDYRKKEYVTDVYGRIDNEKNGKVDVGVK
jgi:hypothetical protein